MDNYLFPYLLLMAHMASGALWLIRINRSLDPLESRRQWTKYITYVLIVNLLWFCILYSQLVFIFLGLGLIVLASLEWWRAIHKLKGKLWFILPFLLVLAGFWRFLYLEQGLLLFTWFVVVLFDGSSQIAGQLAGRHKLLPKISPNKTVEGLAGGAVITLATTMLVRSHFSLSWAELILASCLMMSSAFLGDLLASVIKRKSGIDNFGRIIPGHGGVLDRFDSLIFTGAMVYLASLIMSPIG